MSFKLLERLGVLLLLAAALVPRVRDLGGPFDREFDGFQGSCFAAFCINYERYGFGAFGGYPSYFVDLPDEAAGEELDPSLFVYANHPPAVPLLCWAALKALGPDGWSDAWREHRPPEGIEPVLRLPTFVFHVLGLLAFWWALRQAGGPRVALLGLAVLAMTPISIVYAQLVNYENTSLFFVCLAYGFHARHVRGMPGRNLLWCALGFVAATAVTFAPFFFVPPLLLVELRRRGLRATARTAVVLVPAALAPILAHGLWVRLALPLSASQTLVDRVGHMLAPLVTGELPFGEWLRRQAVRIAWFFSLPIALAAAAGLVVALARGRGAPGARRERDRPVALGPPLLAGGVLYLLGFYAHTFDGSGVRNGQTVFLLDLAPGIAACAAALLDALAAPLARLKGGVAPLVVVTSMIGLPGVARANELRRIWRAPGPLDVAPGVESRGPAVPLPSTTGAALHALLPPGSITFYPAALGFTQAPSYYAWRSLVSVEHGNFGQRVGAVGRMGLGERERFLLLPKDPPPAVRAQMRDVRDQLAAGGPPFAEDARWEVWALAEDE